MKTAIPRAAAVILAFLLLSMGQNAPAAASPETHASLFGAGCYIAPRNRCKLHVDPFTIRLNGKKNLIGMQLAVTNSAGTQSLLYDFRTNSSHAARHAEDAAYSPSLVAQDFGVTCGESYSLSLISMEVARTPWGDDDDDDRDDDKDGDSIILSKHHDPDDGTLEMRTLSTTGVFTCPDEIAVEPPPPADLYPIYLPLTINAPVFSMP